MDLDWFEIILVNGLIISLFNLLWFNLIRTLSGLNTSVSYVSFVFLKMKINRFM